MNVYDITKKYNFSGKRILVVDDDLPSVNLVKAMLKNTGVDMISVNNGIAAIDLASKENIDAILMDITLPVMDGYTATKAIHSSKPSLPIIAYTGWATTTDVKRSMDAGCYDHLSKPVSHEKLLETLGKYLK